MTFWIFLGSLVLLATLIKTGHVLEDKWDWYRQPGWLETLLAFMFLLSVLVGVVAFVAGFVLGIGLLGHGHSKFPEEQYACNVPSTALGNSTAVSGSGSLFLVAGSFSVDEEQTITYVTDNGDYKELNNKPANKSRIVEDNSVEPHLECRVEKKIEDGKWLAPWLKPVEVGAAVNYYFYVPEGSVSTDFSVEP